MNVSALPRQRLLDEARSLQFSLHQEFPPDSLESPYGRCDDLASRNARFLREVERYPGDTVQAMIESSGARARRSDRLESATFNVGMGLTVGGLLGLGAAAFWSALPLVPSVAASVAALVAGPVMTGIALSHPDREPHREMTRDLRAWADHLQARPAAAPDPAVQTWSLPGDLPLAKVTERVSGLQKSLEGSQDRVQAGLRVYGDLDRARKLNPKLLAALGSGSRGTLGDRVDRAHRWAGFHRIMADKVCDEMEQTSGITVGLGLILGLISPRFSVVQGLVGGALAAGLLFAGSRLESWHRAKADENKEVGILLDRWQGQIGQETAPTHRRVSEVRQMVGMDRAEAPGVIEEEPETVLIGSVRLGVGAPAAEARE